MTTPKILYHDDPKRIWAAGGRLQPWRSYQVAHYGEGDLDEGQYDQARVVAYAPTCCVLIHRSVFDRIGLMDSRYFIYWDDVDFMYRAMKCRLQLMYLPDARLLHKVSSLSGQIMSAGLIRYTTRNRFYFMRKHRPGIVSAFWVVLYKGYLLTRFLLRKDSRSVWDLKRSAVAEGVEMASSQLRSGMSS